MALWKETDKPGAAPVPNIPTPTFKEPERQPPPPPARPMADTSVRAPRMEQKESVIAAGLAIEGKIEGAGHVRIAGNFKGDVHVEGNLTIEPGAKLTGGVKAKTVTVGGELEGNIDAASAVELASTGVHERRPQSRHADRIGRFAHARPGRIRLGSHRPIQSEIREGRHCGMSTTRSVSPGKSRRCPHCRSEILESASICPVCRHHLKHGLAAEQAGERFSALHVEGTIRHPAGNTPWEYSVTITIRNQKGEEVARQMVGIGSMSGNDLRTFDLSVDVFAPEVVAATPAGAESRRRAVGAPDIDR